MDRNRGFDINALRQQLEDLFEDFFPSGGARRPSGGRGDQGQHLPVNLVESEEAFVLTAPLPGLQPEDIEINVRGQNLSLRAQRKGQPAERPNYVRREWGFGPFQRNVDLPAPVDAEHASAAFRQGVVTITIPKAERARTITIEEPETNQPEQAAPTEQATTEELVTEPAGGEETTVPVSEEGQGDESRGGRSFYMPRQERGRRGRYQSPERNLGPAPEAQPETEPEMELEAEAEAAGAPDETASAVTPETEGETAEQVMAESEAEGAEGAESTTTSMEAAPETVAELETPSETPSPENVSEPEVEAQAGVGSEPERPQEPGAEDASPVAHTTTASPEAQDLSDQAGEATEAASGAEAAEPGMETGEVTDAEDAPKSQTGNEPTD